MTNAIVRRLARLEAATATGIGKLQVLLIPHGAREEQVRHDYVASGQHIDESDRVLTVHFVRAR